MGGSWEGGALTRDTLVLQMNILERVNQLYNYVISKMA